MNLIDKVAALDEGSFNLSIADADSSLNIRNVAVKVINFILIIAAILAVIYLIYSGILYLTAAGNEANADKGKKGIINAIIGIIIIVLAFVILRVVNNAATNAVA